jgi:hypothetical protein
VCLRYMGSLPVYSGFSVIVSCKGRLVRVAEDCAHSGECILPEWVAASGDSAAVTCRQRLWRLW